MRILPLKDLESSPGIMDEVVQVLREDGLVCFPGHRQYNVVSALLSPDAVIRLVQSKRRAGKAPALVLVPDRSALEGLVQDIPAMAGPLFDAFWPGPLTVLLSAGPDIPAKVKKTIWTKKGAKIGVRVPAHGLTLRILAEFGEPLLASSANLSKRIGASSVSHIRKDFAQTVDLLIDAGDLPPSQPSTVVDIGDDGPRIVREGVLSLEQIESALRDAGMLSGS